LLGVSIMVMIAEAMTVTETTKEKVVGRRD
jgi:hypothetical protein